MCTDYSLLQFTYLSQVSAVRSFQVNYIIHFYPCVQFACLRVTGSDKWKFAWRSRGKTGYKKITQQVRFNK